MSGFDDLHQFLPEKYKTALALLQKRDQSGFIEFASSTRLDYDACNVSGYLGDDRTLFEAAVSRRLWRCVEFMVDMAAPTWQDVALSYGYADEVLSRRLWSRFVAANGGRAPAKLRYRSDRVLLVEAFALKSAHISLIKLMFELGLASNPVNVCRVFGDPLPLPLWYLTEPMRIGDWTSDLFVWLTNDYTIKELGITDAHIERVLRDWASKLDLFAWDEEPLCKHRADQFEAVFWKLQAMHTNAARFAECAKKIPVDGSARFAAMLACIGVLSEQNPEPDITAEVPCSHCNGTGKVIGIDAQLAQDAKKRRIEKLAVKGTS
jgi:hypothetical protein